MSIIGMIIAAVILALSFIIAGPYGIGIFLIVLFGMVFSTYVKNKQVLEDLRTIREKLGLLTEDEKIDIEIEKRDTKTKSYNELSEDPPIVSEIDKEIEEELERYAKENQVIDFKDNEENQKKD